MSSLSLKEIYAIRFGAELAADPSCPGLIARVSADGRRTWAYRYRADGVLRRLTLGLVPATPSARPHEMTLKAAREAYYAARAKRQQMGDPLVVRRRERLARLEAARDAAITVQSSSLLAGMSAPRPRAVRNRLI
jgi:hypothetical protein